jgi:hypothetical protein
VGQRKTDQSSGLLNLKLLPVELIHIPYIPKIIKPWLNKNTKTLVGHIVGLLHTLLLSSRFQLTPPKSRELKQHISPMVLWFLVNVLIQLPSWCDLLLPQVLLKCRTLICKLNASRWKEPQ